MEKKLGHPYLSGNFSPIDRTTPLTPCLYEGTIPLDLAGGEYVRNGGNPITNNDLGRDAHWFDGDGMLSGVLFRRMGKTGDNVRPEFVNQYLLTDVYCFAKENALQRPVLPSIATLMDSAAGLATVLSIILRTLILAILSRFSNHPIKKISVANTNIVFHDGRALATCESGPPLRFALPGLETVGWFNGKKADNEPGDLEPGFGGHGVLSFMREWTTGHPRVDPISKELIAFHSTFVRPFVRYSIVQPSCKEAAASSFDSPVPGISAPKLMHDFGVSRQHTIIMDLPLSLDPFNNLRGSPSLHYDTTKRSRFGIFPRYEPTDVQWFETNPCLIFHTANCWDSMLPGKTQAPKEVVNLLACRLTSASMLFTAGGLPMPKPQAVPLEYAEEDQCRLYFYSFLMGTNASARIAYQWALSAMPFEFPTMSPSHAMQECQYIYGTTTSDSFTAALGKAAKIDYLSKFDVKKLIARGMANPPPPVKGCVDTRTVQQVHGSKDSDDPIKLFRMPTGWFAQEPRFVPRSDPRSEDDGWLLTYVFDESQLADEGHCRDDSKSELWIIDARDMKDVVAKIKLPQRVPYGLHGNWFSESEIQCQQPYESIRQLDAQPGCFGFAGKALAMLERWSGQMR